MGQASSRRPCSTNLYKRPLQPIRFIACSGAGAWQASTRSKCRWRPACTSASSLGEGVCRPSHASPACWDRGSGKAPDAHPPGTEMASWCPSREAGFRRPPRWFARLPSRLPFGGCRRRRCSRSAVARRLWAASSCPCRSRPCSTPRLRSGRASTFAELSNPCTIDRDITNIRSSVKIMRPWVRNDPKLPRLWGLMRSLCGGHGLG